MSRIAYVNGHYVRHSEAAIHIEDRGYQFADGVYEVIAVTGGRLLDEGPHFDRLERSLGELAIPRPMSRRALSVVIHECVRRNRVGGGDRLPSDDAGYGAARPRLSRHGRGHARGYGPQPGARTGAFQRRGRHLHTARPALGPMRHQVDRAARERSRQAAGPARAASMRHGRSTPTASLPKAARPMPGSSTATEPCRHGISARRSLAALRAASFSISPSATTLRSSRRPSPSTRQRRHKRPSPPARPRSFCRS